MHISRQAAALTILLYCITGQLQAQILNLDREDGRDTLNRRWMVNANLDLSTDKQKYRLINLDLKTEIDRLFCNDYVLILQAGNDLVFNGKESIQNEGMIHLRFHDNDNRQPSQLSKPSKLSKPSNFRALCASAKASAHKLREVFTTFLYIYSLFNQNTPRCANASSSCCSLCLCP